MFITVRKIKLLLVIAAFLVAVIFIIMLLLPSRVTISKSITINASKEKVASQLNDFNNWKNWFPLFQNKNIATKIFGKGKNEYAILTSGNKELEFVLNRQAQDTIYVYAIGNYISQTYKFTLLNNSQQTKLTWDVEFYFKKYSVKKFASLFIYQVKSQQYEDILKNLESEIEKTN